MEAGGTEHSKELLHPYLYEKLSSRVTLKALAANFSVAAAGQSGRRELLMMLIIIVKIRT